MRPKNFRSWLATPTRSGRPGRRRAGIGKAASRSRDLPLGLAEREAGGRGAQRAAASA